MNTKVDFYLYSGTISVEELSSLEKGSSIALSLEPIFTKGVIVYDNKVIKADLKVFERNIGLIPKKQLDIKKFVKDNIKFEDKYIPFIRKRTSFEKFNNLASYKVQLYTDMLRESIQEFKDKYFFHRRFKFLNDYSSEFIAKKLINEHPQVIAIVSYYFNKVNKTKCSEVLGSFPEELRAEVVMKVAYLRPVRKQLLVKLAYNLWLSFDRDTNKKSFEGIKSAKGILNSFSDKRKAATGAYIEQVNDDLANKLLKD